MRFGTVCTYWQRDWGIDYSKYLEKLKKLGFDAMEISAVAVLEMTDAECSRLNEAAGAANMELTAGMALPGHLDVASTDETIRKNGIEFLKKIIVKLNCAGIKKLGGVMYTSWPADFGKVSDKRDMLAQSIRSMKELAEFAKRYGVTFVVEITNRYENFLLNDVNEARNYVDNIGKENVKIMLDCFHMNIEEDGIPAAIRKAGRYLGHIHICEGNRKLPGFGDMPWPEIGKALRDIDYGETVVMECAVLAGGEVAAALGVWRDLSENIGEAEMDVQVKRSLEMVRNAFESAKAN